MIELFDEFDELQELGELDDLADVGSGASWTINAAADDSGTDIVDDESDDPGTTDETATKDDAEAEVVEGETTSDPDTEIVAVGANAIVEDETEVADGGTVWDSSEGGNPLEGSTTGVSVKGEAEVVEEYDESGNVTKTYYKIALSKITQITLSAHMTSPLVVNGGKGGIFQSLMGQALNIDMSSGKPSSIGFANGIGHVRMYKKVPSSSDVLASAAYDDTVDIKFGGAFTSEDTNEIVINANDPTKFDGIVMSSTEGGTLKINGAYKGFTLNDVDVDIEKVASGTYTFTNLADGDMSLDLSELVQASTTSATRTGISVVSAGGADIIYPPDAYTKVTIGGTTYQYALATDSEAYFKVSDNAVTGFVFDETGDAITLASGSTLALYQLDSTNAENELDFGLTVDGNSTITKTDDGYALSVFSSSTVTLGEVTMDFTISTATKKAYESTGVVTINFDETGALLAVGGLDHFVAGDSMAVTGAVATDDTEGLPVGAVGSVSYIATASGEFTYSGLNASGDTAITFSDADETFYSINSEADRIIPGGTSGTITDPNGNEWVYTSAGTAYFTTDTGAISGFVFEAEGDSLAMHEDVDLTTGDFSVQYLRSNNLYDVTGFDNVAVTSEGGYTLTMTTAPTSSVKATFEISELAAGAEVDYSGNGVTFGEDVAGGTVEFAVVTEAAAATTIKPVGVIAAEGDTVTFDAGAAKWLWSGKANATTGLFAIDGGDININVGTVTELVYNSADKSLNGLASGTAIYQTGNLEKLFVPETATGKTGNFTFGTSKTVYTFTSGEESTAYFTVAEGAATGFAFNTVGDSIKLAGSLLSGGEFQLSNAAAGEEAVVFTAPAVTKDGKDVSSVTITKANAAISGGDKQDYFTIDAGTNYEFAFTDGPSILFNDKVDTKSSSETKAQIAFDMDGKLLCITGLVNAGSAVTVANAADEILIGESVTDLGSFKVNITGGGFTYTIQEDGTPSLTNLLAGSTVVEAAVPQLWTKAGESGTFTFGASSAAATFDVAGTTDTDGIGFIWNNDDQVVSAITSIEGDASVTGALDGLTFNDSTEALAIENGGDKLVVFDEGKSLGGMSAGAVVTATGGISTFGTGESDGTFTIMGTSVAVAGEADGVVKFAFDGTNVTNVNELNGGTVFADFANIATVNDTTFDITDDDGSFAVTGNDAGDGIAIIGDVDGVNGATITDAGGAAVVNTSSEGGFSFASGQAFFIVGDNEVSFLMDTTQAAAVSGIAGFGDVAGQSAVVMGNLVGVDIDGVKLDVTGDEDGVLGYAVSAEGTKSLGLVGGSEVTLGNVGGADEVAVVSEGTYNFATQSYVLGASAATFGMSGATVASIADLNGAVTGDFSTEGFTVNGKALQITGNDTVEVTADENGIASLAIGDGAVIVAAEGVTEATAAGDGTYTDASGNVLTVSGAGETFTIKLDGEGNFVGVDGLGDDAVVSGNINGLAINGGESIIVLDNTQKPDLTYSNGVLAGVVPAETVVSADGATLVSASGNGVYQFGGELGGQTFTVEGDTDAINFTVTDGNVVTAITELGVGAQVSGPLNGIAVNGTNVQVEGDDNFGVVAGEAGIAAITNLGGSVAIVEAGGASAFATDAAAELKLTAAGEVTINDTLVDVTDADKSYTAVVTEDGTVAALTAVTGDATVNVASMTVVADGDGAFAIGGKDYTFTDSDSNFSFNTDADKQLTAISDLNGSVAFAGESAVALGVNGAPVTLATNANVEIVADESGVTAIKGLASGDSADGDLANAQVELVTNDQDETITVSGTKYAVTGDKENVSITGAGVVTGLDEDALLVVTGSGDVTVNGVTFTAEQVADGTIVGSADGTSAYIYDATNPLITKGTPVDTIEEIVPLPSYQDAVVYGSEEAPLTKEQTDSISDLNQKMEIYATNTDTEAQDLNFASPATEGTKKVHLYEGTQNVEFNDEYGNLAIVEDTAQGVKNITLGDGGDAVIVDGTADHADSKVNIIGGAGADSVFARGDVPVTFDMSEGGADKLVTFAASNARVTLDGYDESTGAAIVIQERGAADIAAAIDSGLIQFADDGVVAVDRGDGRRAEVQVNNVDPYEQTIVILGNNEGDTQMVGFTDSDGGTLDASDEEEDLIVIGNKGGEKAGANISTGDGNDTIFAGANDTINAGGGSNIVKLTANRDEGAELVLSEGDTTVEGFQVGFGDNGDVLDTDGSAYLELNGSNLIITGADGAYTANIAVGTADVVNIKAKGDRGSIENVALAAEDKTIAVDADVAANVDEYLGTNKSGIDFSAYAGDVNLKLNENSGTVGGKGVYLSEIATVTGGSGDNIFYGSDADEKFVAGAGTTAIYAAGGTNTLVGYSGDDKMGATAFYVTAHTDGAMNLIQNFEAVEDDGENIGNTADILTLDLANNQVAAINATSDGNVYIAVNNGGVSGVTETVVLEGMAGEDFQVDGSGVIAQVGSNEVTVDEFANYYNASENNATLKIGSGLDGVDVWLEDSVRSKGKEFVGDFAVIDARGSSATAVLAGNSDANTIYAGDNDTTLWGGGGFVNDELYGGSGKNAFAYEYGDGEDTIHNAKDGDMVFIFGEELTIDKVTATEFTSTGVKIQFADGGSVSVEGAGEIDYVLTNGQVSGTYRVNAERNDWEAKS